MKMKKGLAIALCVVLAAGSFSIAGCGKNNMVKDGKTINVKLFKGGYGTAWFEGIAEKFETLYAEEGYKVNLIDPSNSYAGNTILNELRNYKNGDAADLYIVEGVYVRDVIDATYGVCVENLNDVYNSGAISFDGTVSETPIKDMEGAKKYQYMLTDPLDSNEYYSYQWYASTSGLVCNQKVLADYGFDYLPRTTDEMFEMYDAIYYGANGKQGSKQSGVYPVTWAGENAYGYAYAAFMNQFASMLGHSGWDDFFTLDHLRDDIENGYKYYEEIQPELTAALESFIQTYDVVYSAVGSSNQKHDMAHAQLITGSAAFMTDGSYFYNEVKANFSQYLPNMRIISYPMISEFGVMLKLDGSGNDAAKCDDILSYLCQCFDEGMEQAEMKAAAKEKFPDVTLTDEQIQKVWEARGLQYQSLQGQAYIAKNSEVKDITALLLRMMASEDAANLMQESCLPSAYITPSATDYKNPFIGDVMRISSRSNKTFFLYYPSGLRYETAIETLGFTSSMLVSEVTGTIGVVTDPADRDYRYWADFFYNKINKNIKDNWASRMTIAGY